MVNPPKREGVITANDRLANLNGEIGLVSNDGWLRHRGLDIETERMGNRTFLVSTAYKF